MIPPGSFGRDSGMARERRTPVPRGLKRTGPPLLHYGFRPFFLGGAAFACISMAVWVAALIWALPVGGDYGGPLWHAHELLFGFAPAVLAGFLLTAIPNWTGRLPVAGLPLALLALLWLAGRVAMAMADALGMSAAAAIDMLFLPALLAIAAREIIAGRKWNDLKILAGVGAITAGNLGFHGVLLWGGDSQLMLRIAVAGYVVLVLIVGGRIIPSFTHNWLNRRGDTVFPAPYGRFDVAVIAASAAALGCWATAPDLAVTALAAAGAATLNITRMARWRGGATRDEALLFVLHAAYTFAPLGFLAIAAAAIGLLQDVSALHVFTVGVIGCTMLAVMTRVTRGHTGRPLTASRMTVAAYVCLFAAALARPLADIVEASWIMSGAGLLWIAAFALFLIEYGPMLVRARQG